MDQVRVDTGVQHQGVAAQIHDRSFRQDSAGGATSQMQHTVEPRSDTSASEQVPLRDPNPPRMGSVWAGVEP